MAETTTIEWADATFNPWIGCTKVGPGCDHCYAEALDKRYGGGKHWGPGATRRQTSDAYWKQPYKWNRKAQASGKPWRVFAASQADIFDNEVAQSLRDRFWQVVKDTPALTWLIVTKRIGNAKKMLPADWGAGYPNVVLIITVVNQPEADRDIIKLLTTPAWRRGLSVEPMIGPMNLRRIDLGTYPAEVVNRPELNKTKFTLDALKGAPVTGIPPIDWVIVGGESGHGARPMHPDWARSLRDQCAAAGVPFFFKQWGEWAVGSDFKPDAKIVLNDGRVLDDGDALHALDKSDYPAARFDPEYMRRLGKKAAGRLLDGIEHNGFPAAIAREARP